MWCIEKEPIYDGAALVVANFSATWTSLFGDVSVAQLVASMSGVVLGGVVEVVGSNYLQHLTAQLFYYIPLYLSTV